ncbi:MAG: hypothetical protein EA366_01140 [Spirulina sp. DLM2.Bin59]|nr:MAG: hypothetical protein EA366_01140 [Spirulina sp. DLM2.Bin59]
MYSSTRRRKSPDHTCKAEPYPTRDSPFRLLPSPFCLHPSTPAPPVFFRHKLVRNHIGGYVVRRCRS